MKFIIMYKITGKYRMEVEAENLNKAMEKAEEEYTDADFGELKEIEGDPVFVENRFGKRLWD